MLNESRVPNNDYLAKWWDMSGNVKICMPISKIRTKIFSIILIAFILCTNITENSPNISFFAPMNDRSYFDLRRSRKNLRTRSFLLVSREGRGGDATTKQPLFQSTFRLGGPII